MNWSDSKYREPREPHYIPPAGDNAGDLEPDLEPKTYWGNTWPELIYKAVIILIGLAVLSYIPLKYGT